MLVVTDDVREEAGIEAKNADRVRKERAAQQARATQPVQNHRIAAAENNGAGSFDNRPAPNVRSGSGPVSLLTVSLIAWLNRRKKQH